MFLSLVEQHVRFLTHDLKAGKPEVGAQELRRMILWEAQSLASKYGPSDRWVTGAITIAPGTSDFALPAQTLYTMVREVKRQSDGILLRRLPAWWIEFWRQSNPAGTGRPFWYYILEDQSAEPGVTKLRLWPAPNVADVLDLFVAAVPKGPSQGLPDTAEIGLSDLLINALVWRVGAQVVATLLPEALERLKLPATVSAMWLAHAAEAEAEEGARRARHERPARVMAHVR